MSESTHKTANKLKKIEEISMVSPPILYSKKFFENIIIASRYIHLFPILQGQDKLHGKRRRNGFNLIRRYDNGIADAQELIGIKQAFDFV